MEAPKKKGAPPFWGAPKKGGAPFWGRPKKGKGTRRLVPPPPQKASLPCIPKKRTRERKKEKGKEKEKEKGKEKEKEDRLFILILFQGRQGTLPRPRGRRGAPQRRLCV